MARLGQRHGGERADEPRPAGHQDAHRARTVASAPDGRMPWTPTASPTSWPERERMVDEGTLPACQLAVALDGEVVAEAHLRRTRRAAASTATRRARSWSPARSGCCSARDACRPTTGSPTTSPSSGRTARSAITVEQVLLHTSGFPRRPVRPDVLSTIRDARLARLRERWRLNWEPGTRFEYHATSAHWVLAELIERVDRRGLAGTFVTERVARARWASTTLRFGVRPRTRATSSTSSRSASPRPSRSWSSSPASPAWTWPPSRARSPTRRC